MDIVTASYIHAKEEGAVVISEESRTNEVRRKTRFWYIKLVDQIGYPNLGLDSSQPIRFDERQPQSTEGAAKGGEVKNDEIAEVKQRSILKKSCVFAVSFKDHRLQRLLRLSLNMTCLFNFS